jgi:GDPmannose 4,6-dehydratase
MILGDLGVRRDFGFAGDYVEVMQMIVRHAIPDDYVVGSGENHSIEEFCDRAFALVGHKWTDHVEVDQSLIRKVDSHYTRADITKIRSVFGWRPKVNFENLVSIMVHAQIKLLRASIADMPAVKDVGPHFVTA